MKDSHGEHQKAVDRQSGPAATTFSALYHRYLNSIYAYFYRRVGNHADAEDLTEQLFTEVLQKMETYEEQGKAGAWLFTIAHSRVVDYYRSHREHLPFDEALDQPDGQPHPEGVVAHRERRDRLFTLLDQLQDNERELLLLRYGGGLSYREIGHIVGRSEAATKMAIYRLLDRLHASW